VRAVAGLLCMALVAVGAYAAVLAWRKAARERVGVVTSATVVDPSSSGTAARHARRSESGLHLFDWGKFDL
jgi:hypothetical protein